MWYDICLLQLFAHHLVRMVVIAYLSMFASAHKNSEVLNVNMVSQLCRDYDLFDDTVFL
jgi:hypothetical protein